MSSLSDKLTTSVFNSDQLLLDVFENSNLLIIILSQEGLILAFNKKCEIIFKRMSKEVLNNDFFSILKEMKINFTKDDIKLFNKNLKNIRSEINIENNIFVISWNISLTKDSKNHDAFLLLGEDITAIEVSKNTAIYMENIINMVPGVIFLKDTESRFLDCNQAMLDICGLKSKKDFIGKTDYDMPWTKEESDNYRKDDQIVRSTRLAKLNIEETQTFPDGKETILLTNKVPLLDKNGNVIGTLGMFLDITDRKQKENELKIINQKLKKALADIKKARKLEIKLRNEVISYARMAGMAEVTTSVLHNVGNILNSLKCSSSVIEEKISGNSLENLRKITDIIQSSKEDTWKFISENPRGKELLIYLQSYMGRNLSERQQIKEEITLLNKNIEHIVDIISTQETINSPSYEFSEQVSIPDLIDYALVVNKNLYENSSIKITYDYQNILPVYIDKVRLLQILINLIKNSLESLSKSKIEKKNISLHLYEKNKNEFVIQISDTGCGILKENLGKIFTQGYTTKENGHGVGLHNSFILAQKMSGTITVESEGFDQGSTFKIIMPYRLQK